MTFPGGRGVPLPPGNAPPSAHHKCRDNHREAGSVETYTPSLGRLMGDIYLINVAHQIWDTDVVVGAELDTHLDISGSYLPSLDTYG